MQKLVEFSRRYGSDSSLVIAGGGNTSMKEKGVLHIKGSGTALSSITEDDFVDMDISKLMEITKRAYPSGDARREAAFLEDIMAARMPGNEAKRPSVETLLHALFPQRYVLHLHPALVNGLTCSLEGERAAEKLFPDAVWIPERRPGYTLAMTVVKKLSPETDTVLMQNHGVFFAAETPEQLDDMLKSMLEMISSEIEVSGFSGEGSHAELSKPFTPDHIVYCGIGPELPDTENARLLWADANKIAAYARSFGGARPMAADMVEFILNWEAESYRRKKS